MDKKANILFTATFTTPFIQEDLTILKTHFTVTEVISYGIKTFFTYFSAIRSNDISFSWFASVYSSVLVFFAKIFRKKSILILGGVDVAKIPDLNYGIWNSRWRSIIVRYGIKNADIVLAVDMSLKNDAVCLAKYNGNNIHILPTGYDSNRWRPMRQKENIVLAVANCNSMTRVKIKGINFLIHVAETMPNISFILIGLKKEIAVQLQIPINLKYFESMEQSDLLKSYQRAKVFFQPSMREGLPNTLCEAMLCGCFPVGTNIGGIPDAIGKTGIVVEYGNVVEAKKALLQALESENSDSPRDRIIQHYNSITREENLLRYISLLTNEN